MKKGIKMMALLLSLVMILSLFTACSKDSKKTTNENSKTTGEETKATDKKDPKKDDTKKEEVKEPVTIKWARTANEQDPKKDRVLLELQKRTNTKLEIFSIPWDQYPNKLNIMMAAGEEIDLLNIDPGVTVNQWAKDGLILSWDKYLETGKYPHIKAIVDSELYKGLKIDGKVYYKPLPLAPQQWGWVIRKDWLDNVGLDIPTNLDEFYEVVKAFKEKDPDKNGKDDTYGFYANTGGHENGSGSFQYILNAFAINAGAGKWVNLPDGTVTRYEASDAAKEAARFVYKMNKEGLINKDWMSVKWDSGQSPIIDSFANSKMGIALTSIPNTLVEKVKALTPDAEVVFLPPIEGLNGVPANAGHTGGFWWGNVIPATCKDPEAVLELLEYSLTKEGRELTGFGIDGVHFTDKVDEGDKVVFKVNKEECDKDWNTSKSGYLYPLAWGGLNYFEYAYIPITEHNYDFDEAFKNIQAWLPEDMASGKFANWHANNAKYAIPSPLMNMFDEKLLGDQKKLLSYFWQGWLKVVLSNSEKDFDKNWNSMKEKWLGSGGKEIIEYGNEVYIKTK